MSGSGFHWFVAWRYLMARPRRVSPAMFLVAGVLCVVSVAASLIGNLVFRASPPRAFVDIGAHEILQVIALVLLAQSGLTLVWGLSGHVRRDPGRFGVPCLGLASLLAAGIGALAHVGHGLTHDAGVFLLILAASLMLAAGVGYARWQRAAAVSTLVSTALLAAAGHVTWSVGRELFSAGSGLPPQPVLVRGLGLWILGLAAVELVVTGQALRRRASIGALVAALLLVACAVYVQVTGSAGAASELPLDELAAHLLPAGDEPLPHADGWLLAGLGLLGLGVVLGAVGGMLRLGQRLRGEARGMVGLLQLAVACAAAGGLLAVAVTLLRTNAEPYLVFSARQAPEQPFQLTAVAVLALAELAVLLLAMRYVFTFFTTVSVAGVTIGSMALVIVLSVMGGFELDLRNKILGSNAHVLITKDEGAFTEYREVAERIAGIPGVVAQTPYLTSEVMLAASNNLANVIIKGVDPETVGKVTDLARNTRQPQALERLYPLADDGGVLGPPGDAGVAEEAAPPGHDTPPDPAAPDGQGADPPPPDMATDWAAPRDFSGGVLPGEDAPAGTGDAPMELGSEPATIDGTADQPPPDMATDWGAPQDFSGEAGEPGRADDSAEIEAGPVGQADPIFDLPEDLAGAPGRAPGAALDDDWPSAKWDDRLDTDAGPPTSSVRIPERVARLPGVLVGKELVKNLHLYVGQEVRIVSPLTEDTPAGPVPRTRYLRVAGTFFTGMYEYDFKFVYVALSTLQAFLDLEDEVSGIEIRVEDPVETGAVLQDIRAALPPGFRVQDWKEINRNLFSALKLEKIAMFLVLAIIILVASFSIVSNLIMVVVEKAKEIALLKTLGATDGGVVRVFVTQGLFIGLVGTVLGVAHGLVACFLGNLFGLPLDPEVYYIDRLPIHVETLAVVAVGVAGLAISVVATLYPAAMAAQLRPMEGLRYD